MLAHRWAYEHIVGPIQDGMALDHSEHCRIKACVNPAHIVVCTRGENNLKEDGAAGKEMRKTRCRHGHEYSLENTIWDRSGTSRKCRICCNERGSKRYYATRVLKGHANAVKTHCKHGHIFDTSNTYIRIRADGTTIRRCRECHLEDMKRRAIKQRTCG